MTRYASEELLTAIDVGTTKICVLVARKIDESNLEIVGIGKVPSEGLKKGVVVDVAKTVYSIRNAIHQAEIMVGASIEKACIGISGSHIQSINSMGVVPIPFGQISRIDIVNALAAAKAIPVPDGLQILHVLPQYFIIDDRDRVSDPLGMHGIRLEVRAHIILGAIASVQNLVKCCQATGVTVTDVILEQLASAQSVLSSDERELGVGILDIGGGTSDLALYQHGSIRHTMVLPVAGNHFTQDIAIGLGITLQEAERIKKEYGFDTEYKDDALIEVEMVHGLQKRLISRKKLATILTCRAQELLLLVKQEIDTKSLRSFMQTGLVLTGGGSLLQGMHELASIMFDMPVRIGNPHILFDIPESLQNPIYATGYGLLLHALKKQYDLSTQEVDGPFAQRVFNRMKSWVLDFF